jgi:hypothetical protein
LTTSRFITNSTNTPPQNILVPVVLPGAEFGIVSPTPFFAEDHVRILPSSFFGLRRAADDWRTLSHFRIEINSIERTTY